jgi:hypothetical protein
LYERFSADVPLCVFRDVVGERSWPHNVSLCSVSRLENDARLKLDDRVSMWEDRKVRGTGSLRITRMLFGYMFATTGDSSWLPNSSREFKTIFPSLCQTLPHLRISFKCHTRRFHTLSNTPSQPTYVLSNNFTNICPTF